MKVFSMNKFMNSEIIKNLSDEYVAELSKYDGQPIEKIKKEDLKFIPESALIEKEEYDEKENTAELIIKALIRTLRKYNCPKETTTEIILDFMKEFITGDKNKDDDHISVKVVTVNK